MITTLYILPADPYTDILGYILIVKITVYTSFHVRFFASNILIRKAGKVAAEIFSSRNLQKPSNLA